MSHGGAHGREELEPELRLGVGGPLGSWQCPLILCFRNDYMGTHGDLFKLCIYTLWIFLDMYHLKIKSLKISQYKLLKKISTQRHSN